MKLQAIFDQLTFGELKQINVGGFDSGAVQPANYREICNHINLALIKLYARFPMEENYLTLLTSAGKTKYPLSSQYAVSKGAPVPHIIDTLTEPFTDNILRIDSVYDVDTATTLKVNDSNDERSVYLSAYNVIQIPWALGGETLHIAYKAKAASITVPTAAETLDLTKSINIPDSFLEPLLSYVEYRVMKSKGGESGLAQARIAMQSYETACLGMERENILNSAGTTTNTKLEINGWT